MSTKQYGKRDPGSHRTPEQIHAMDHRYNHRPVIVKEREMRNEARAMMKRKLGAKAIEGKDIDQKPGEGRTWWQQYGEPARTFASREPRSGRGALVAQERHRGQTDRSAKQDDDYDFHQTVNPLF